MPLRLLGLFVFGAAFANATTTVSPVDFFRAKISQSAPATYENLSELFSPSPVFEAECVSDSNEPGRAGKSEAALLAQYLPDRFSGSAEFTYVGDPLAGFDLHFRLAGHGPAFDPLYQSAGQKALECETEQGKHDCRSLNVEWKDEFQTGLPSRNYGSVQRKVTAAVFTHSATELYLQMQVDLTLVELNLGGFVEHFNSKHQMGREYFCRLKIKVQ